MHVRTHRVYQRSTLITVSFFLVWGQREVVEKESEKKDVLQRNAKQSRSLICSRLLLWCLVGSSVSHLRA